MMSYKIGDKVKWLDSTYIVIDITNKGVILKQDFSIGTVLTQPVKLEEITLA
jgi:hypothetical protein